MPRRKLTEEEKLKSVERRKLYKKNHKKQQASDPEWRKKRNLTQKEWRKRKRQSMNCPEHSASTNCPEHSASMNCPEESKCNLYSFRQNYNRKSVSDSSDEENMVSEDLCTKQQAEVLEHFKNHLEFENPPIRWMIHGFAGTGKSFLIPRLYMHLMDDSISLKKSPIVMKLAPTGKAAALIHGRTIHSALGIKRNIKKLNPLRRLSHYQKLFKNCQLIIIDEISMVGHNLFLAISERLKEIKGVNETFGGLHVILFGDFYQLPPVKDTPLYHPSPRNLFESFSLYELTENMRQQKDEKYNRLLQHLSTGELTPEEINFLKTKKTTFEKVPLSIPMLFHSNREVDEANEKRLGMHEGELSYSIAQDNVRSIHGSLLPSKEFEVKQLCKIKHDYRIPLKIGAIYMLTYNIDIEDGLVNGAIGILRHVEFSPIHKNVTKVWMQFPEPMGMHARVRNEMQMITKQIPHHLTPIARFKKVIHSIDNVSVTRHQLPLVLAEAMTIHKAQGATFHKCAVGFNRFTGRQLKYVALSRVKSGEHLYIIGDFFPPKKLKENNPIAKAFERLKKNKPISEYFVLPVNRLPIGPQSLCMSGP